MNVPRTRLDLALVQRGLAETRERAQQLILSGAVTLAGVPATRPGQPVASEHALAVAPRQDQYVSRGAHKLVEALDRWGIDPAGKIALDVGASTGGFTDVLLKRGAPRVYAVDAGHGQLHYRLRQDRRVVVMERTNIRHLAELPERPRIAVADVSFISLRLALPPAFLLLHPEAAVVALIKPQFEAGRGQVARGGVVRDPRTHRRVLEELVAWSDAQPWRLAALAVSPVRGPAGNVEFLSRWDAGGVPASSDEIDRVLGESARLTGRGA